ncbi:tetratricopeptide repeat protein [Candidatus Orientia mediorientalis]|nr:tetratricopeptide repeat protein [Candidatus Orientia mediorientalis]
MKYNPNDASAYKNKGIALYEIGQYHETIKNYDTAIKYKPNNASAK